MSSFQLLLGSQRLLGNRYSTVNLISHEEMVRRVYRGKLVVAGDPAVGKSAICQMYSKGGSEFQKNYNMTFAPDVYTKVVPIPGTDDSVELIIYDSPSFELYTDLLGDFWNYPDLLMLVYEVTNPKSLETVPVWFEICRQVDWHGKNGAPVATVLLGNKNDLEHRRKVVENEGLHMAERYLMKHFIGSAKNNQGLEDPFRYLANSYYQHRINEEKEVI